MFRECVVIIVEQREGRASFAKMDKILAESLTGLDEVRVVSFTDTLFKDNELAIAEITCKRAKQDLSLISTFAFYKRENLLVSAICMAPNRSEATNQKYSKLFQQVAYSIR